MATDDELYSFRILKFEILVSVPDLKHESDRADVRSAKPRLGEPLPLNRK